MRMVSLVVVVCLLLSGIPAVSIGTSGAGEAVGGESVPTIQATACAFPLTTTDATGVEIRLDQRPDRVVTLAPSAAQTMWEIGAREQVVGITRYATYLDGAETRQNVSAGYAVSAEKVIAAEPDLVLAPNVTSSDTIRTLRDAGLTVYAFSTPTSIDQVRENTRRIGELTGNCEGASGANAWMDRNLEAVQEAVADEPRPRTLYVFFGYTAGVDTFADDMIRAAGGVNVMSEAGVTGFKPVNDEVVVERDPQAILLNSDGPTVPEAYANTTAVREGRVGVLDANHVSQPAPRSVVYAVRNMTKALHPAAFESVEYVSKTDVETRQTTTDTTARTATTGATTRAQSTESGGVPGFGVGIAAVSVLVVALVARRD